jgi:Holliday junction resolvase YEN1
VQLKPIRAKKTADPDAPAKSEVRILCSPAELVEIDLSERPPEENWEKFAAKDGTPYDPFQKLECYILDCLLQNGLPQSVLARPLEPAKRSKSRASDKAIQITPDPASQADASGRHSPAVPPLEPGSKKRGRPPKDSSDRPKPSKKKQKVDENVEARLSPPPTKFIRLDIPELVKRKPEFVDLDGDDESWTDLTETGAMPTTNKPLAVPATSSSHSYASKRSLYSSSSSLSTAATSDSMSLRPPAVVAAPQELPRTVTSGHHRAEEAQGPSDSHRPAMLASPLASSTAEELVPGGGISLAALRELRLAAFTQKNFVPRVTLPDSSLKDPGQADEASQPPSKLLSRPLSKPSSKQSFQTEVIDLT